VSEVIGKIRLVSDEESADDLLVKAVKAAFEEARYHFAIREAIDSEEVHEARIREFEYARGIGFYAGEGRPRGRRHVQDQRVPVVSLIGSMTEKKRCRGSSSRG
jgi:hypothetical protein